MTIQCICISTSIRAYLKRMSLLTIVVLCGITSSLLLAADLPGSEQIPTSQIANNQTVSGQLSNNYQIVSDEELDTLRGGFTLPSGLVVDFSFDKRIYQNGIESFYTYFELPQDVVLSRSVTSGVASNFTNMLNSVTQNNFDNQIIKTINTVNIDISNIKNVNLDVNRSAFFRDLIGPSYK